MRRFVLGEVRRLALLTVAVVCLIVGTITLPLPLPTGLLLIVVGVSLLLMSSPAARARFHALRLRSAFLDENLRRVEHRLPKSLQKALKHDDPS